MVTLGYLGPRGPKKKAAADAVLDVRETLAPPQQLSFR